MSENKVFLELNYNTLKALVQDNPELLVFIRNGIVQTFSEKFLKHIVDKDYLDKLNRERNTRLQEMFETEFSKTIGTYSWSSFKLKKDVKEKLDNHIKKNVNNILKGTIEEHEKTIIEKINNNLKELEPLIYDMVKKAVEKTVNNIVSTNIKKLLTES